MLVIFAWLMMAFTAVAGLVYQPAPSAGALTDYLGYNVWGAVDVTPPGPDITTGLLLAYDTDTYTNASGKIPDTSGNGNDGTISGYVQYLGEQNGLRFIDDSYLTLDNTAFSGRTNATIAAWLRVGDTSSDGIVFSDEAPLVYFLNSKASGFNTQLKSQIADTTFNWNEDWTHYMATYNGTTGETRVYWDGVFTTNNTSAVGPVGVGGTEYIAFAAGLSGFNGDLGSFRIYDRILNPTQMVTMINATDKGTDDVRYARYSSWPTNQYGWEDETTNAWSMIARPNVASGPIKTNGYLRFDAAGDYAEVSPRIIPRGRSHWSCSAWFHTDDTGNADIFYSGNGPFVFYFGSTLRLRVFTEGGTLKQAISTSIDLSDGWHHFAGVCDLDEAANTNRLTLWIDGAEATASWSADIPTNFHYNLTTDLNVGLFAAFGWYDGNMDDVRFYDEPLTMTQVTNLYQTGRQ